ncbi:MAG: hypothetical protein IJ807_05895 [Eubacterium sp.]|nr:hypothetical protein [Eubacterium sp.]
MRKNWKKTTAALLTLALAVSGIPAVGDGSSARAAAKSDIVVKTVANEDTSSPVATNPPIEVVVAATATPEPSAAPMSDKQRLSYVIESANIDNENKLFHDFYVQRKILRNQDGQLAAFAADKLMISNAKVKVSLCDLDGDGFAELFALYPNKKLEFYEYDYMMAGVRMDEVKPLLTLKNVKEVKKGKKSTFTVKQVNGKKTTFTTYKYSYTKVKKTSIYTKKGKVYKKGSKKIKKKAYNKYVKSYKKLKKVAFAAPDENATVFKDADYLVVNDDECIRKMDITDENYRDKVDEILVVKNDKDDAADPYKAFKYKVMGEGETEVDETRYVLGKDVEKDWKIFRSKNMNPCDFIEIFRAFVSDQESYDVSFNGDETTGAGVYQLTVVAPDGAEADMYYEVIVGNRDGVLVPERVAVIDSVGVTSDIYEFNYGVEYDGQRYDPLALHKYYANAEYVEDMGKTVRTLKADIEGTVKEFKTVNDVRFELYTFDKYYVPVGDKQIDVTQISEGGDDYNAVDSVLNPDSGDVGYLDASATVIWKPYSAPAASTVNDGEVNESDPAAITKATLISILDELDVNSDTELKEDVYFQKYEPTLAGEALDAYAYDNIWLSNKKVKTAIYDVDGDDVEELFVLYPNKTLEIYSHTSKMSVAGANVKPMKTIKNVTEVRKGKTSKGTFTVKQVKGKKTTFTTFKLSFDVIKKSTQYSKKGKVYKKGSKKIKKKAYNKYVKTYKKLKKAAFGKPSGTSDFEKSTDYMLMSKSGKVVVSNGTGKAEGEEPLTVVMSKDLTNQAEPYQAFMYDGVSTGRFVFGKNAKKDYDSLLGKFGGVYSPFLGFTTLNLGTMRENAYYTVECEPAAVNMPYSLYTIKYVSDDNVNSWTWEVKVDESGETPKVIELGTKDEYGAYVERWLVSYGEEAQYDGQSYETGIEGRIYADPEYMAVTGLTERTLTVDMAGTEVKFKTANDVKFMPYTTDKFTVLVNGAPTEITFVMDDETSAAVDRVLNPESGDATRYLQPADKVTWTEAAATGA